MDHLDVNAFIAVADLGSFKSAAETLYVSESTVSRRVRALEDELGVELLNRSRKGTTLTDDGKALIGSARGVVEAAGLLKQEAKMAALRHHRVLRIGYIGWPYEDLVLVSAIDKARKRYPDLDVTMHMGMAADIVEGLDAGRLDAALLFGGTMALSTPCSQLLMGSSPAIAILPVDHPKAKKKVLSMADLSGQELLYEGPWGGGLWSERFRDLLEGLGATGITLKLVSSYKSIPALVAAGQGIGIANKWMSNPFPRHIVYRPINDDRYETRVEFVWNRAYDRGVAESFAADLRESFDTLFD